MYVDLNTIHNPAPSTAPPAAWGSAVNDNFEWLYHDKPTCIVRSTGFVVPTDTETSMEFNSELYDNASMWSNGSGISLPTSGVYFIFGQVTFGTATGGTRRYARLRTTSGLVLAQEQTEDSSTGTCAMSFTTMDALTSSHTVELRCFHDRGSSMSVTAWLAVVYYG